MSGPAKLADVGLFGSMDRYGDLGVHAILDLKRSFSQQELEQAFRGVIAAFPVFGCVYEPRFLRDHWVPAKSPLADAARVVTTDDLEGETRRWTTRPLEPTRERPLRLVLLPMEGGGARLIVSISHLAVDGAGMAAVGHVLACSLYGVSPTLPLEARRDLRPTLAGLSWFHLPVLARDALRVLMLPARTFAAARRERPYPADGSPGPTTRHLVFEEAEISALRARCGPGVSVNDLLVAAVARVGATRSRGGATVVLYTMDLRRFSGRPHLSATNASSILTALVPREATTDLPRAAAAVGAITAKHRGSLVGPAFLLLPMALSALTPHGLLRRLVPGIHAVAVDLPLSRGLVVTNVGRIDGGLGPLADDIVALRVVGPNIRGVQAPTLVAFGFRGRLHVELFAAPGLGEGALDAMERELHEALERPRAPSAI